MGCQGHFDEEPLAGPTMDRQGHFDEEPAGAPRHRTARTSTKATDRQEHTVEEPPGAPRRRTARSTPPRSRQEHRDDGPP